MTYDLRLHRSFLFVPLFFLAIASYIVIVGLGKQQPWTRPMPGAVLAVILVVAALACLVLTIICGRTVLLYRCQISPGIMRVRNWQGSFEIPIEEIAKISYEKGSTPRAGQYAFAGRIPGVSERFFVYWRDARIELHSDLVDTKTRMNVALVLLETVPHSKQRDVVNYVKKHNMKP